MKRVNPGEQLRRNDAPICDALLKEDFPNLYDHLTATTYDEGGNRLTSTVLVFVDNGVLKICLNDRDNCRSAFFTAVDLMGCLMAAERALADGTADWRRRNGSPSNRPDVPF